MCESRIQKQSTAPRLYTFPSREARSRRGSLIGRDAKRWKLEQGLLHADIMTELVYAIACAGFG